MRHIVWPWLAAMAFALLAFHPARSLAQTDEIQVYDGTIAPVGIVNLTLHNNFTPDGGRVPAEPGGVIPNHSLNGVPEWAYGVTKWFEAGLYLPLYSVTGSGAVLYNGFKLRTLFVEPHAADHRFVYGINFEYSFSAAHWEPHPYNSEIRPIIGWHLGRLELMFNPILDNNYEGFGKLDFAPEMRVGWTLSRAFTVAAEEYDDYGPIEHFNGHDQQLHQLFAVTDYTSQTVSVEFGVGFGLTPATDHRVVKLMFSWNLNGPGS